jgi:hypothetical protein
MAQSDRLCEDLNCVFNEVLRRKEGSSNRRLGKLATE